jgi:predicted transcriptional regulator
VTSIIKREQVQRFESQAVVDKAFGGSLPGFVAALMSGRQLSDEDADALLSLIDKYRGERNAAD